MTSIKSSHLTSDLISLNFYYYRPNNPSHVKDISIIPIPIKLDSLSFDFF